MKRREFMKLAGAAAIVGLPGDELFATPPKQVQFGCWIGADLTADEYKRLFERMKQAGMTMAIPNVPHEKVDTLPMIASAAADNGLELHVWRVSMLSPDELKTHPEWYGVSRSGVSTAVKPPYVDYYRFMCPVRPEVQSWLRSRIALIADVPGIKSVHLDYIRYPDVILAHGLWKKYHIVQDKEYPEYDFCYCDVCRETFKAQTGLDPLKLPDPPSNQAWVQFRWNAITSLVNKLYADVHAKDKLLTAAVFPTPAIARSLVRQDWVNWQIDGLMPMIYHSFYEEPVSWIGDATKLGVAALRQTKPLYSGLFIPALTPEEMVTATKLSLQNGAAGVVYFDARALTDAHWQKLPELTKA